MDISRLRNRCDRNQLRSYFLWTTSIKSAMLSLENYKLLSVFACRTDLFRLQHFQNAFFSRHKYESNRMILYFLWSLINALGFLKNDVKYFSILNFYENDSQFKDIPRPNATSWETPVTTCKSLELCSYFHLKPTSKSRHPTETRSRAGTADMGTILPPKNPENSFLPSLKYCPLFDF